MRAWLKRHIPKREDLLGNRFLRPFARHLASPNLWHFNRHSVPRGVAVGLFCGVLMPVAHTPVAILAASPVRANAIVAVAATWVINPVTLGPLLIAAHWIGRHVARVVVPSIHVGWLHGAMAMVGETMVGLLPIALAAAALGYGLALAGWRLRVSRRWARRRRA